MIWVNSITGLDAFRQQWTGSEILDLLPKHNGQVLVDWALGVGKSTNIDQVIECAIREDRYDLVLVLTPTRRILAERAWILSPPADIRIVNLRPRPVARCGPLDGLWRLYERNNLASLGRQELCASCNRRARCYWPEQYGSSLEGTQVVFATQAHLERSPVFLVILKSWCNARRSLTLLDEANFITKTAKRRIGRVQLNQLQQSIQALIEREAVSWMIKWKRYLQILSNTTKADLETGAWSPPFLPPDKIAGLQALGRDRWGDSYRFIGYELQLFGKSLPESREINRQGDLSFAVLPQVPGDFLIYSGSSDHGLTQHRLGHSFAAPFSGYRFFHPGTRWYNIASRIGAKKYFLKNSPQVLDFFSLLVAERIQSGNRVLLVSKKAFLDLCREGIETRLHQSGHPKARVVIASDTFRDARLQDPQCIPIIHFGVLGTNRFEHFECCYCLTSFYIQEQVLHDTLQDLYRQDIQVSLEIGMKGSPLRRYARVKDPRHRFTNVNRLAQAALEHLEMGMVSQAVGRVRHYTRPREVITMQCSPHPEDDYTREFQNLGEARLFFDTPDGRVRKRMNNRDKVQRCKHLGKSQNQTVRATGLSLSTIKRHWKDEGGVTTPNIMCKRPSDTLTRGGPCD